MDIAMMIMVIDKGNKRTERWWQINDLMKTRIRQRVRTAWFYSGSVALRNFRML